MPRTSPDPERTAERSELVALAIADGVPSYEAWSLPEADLADRWGPKPDPEPEPDETPADPDGGDAAADPTTNDDRQDVS